MPKPPKKTQADQYLKYSGMAFQLAIVLGVGTFLGSRLDRYFQTKHPYFTALLALLSLFAGLYLSLKDLFFVEKPPKDPKDE
ncbi:MAG: AtpZ/AtpI family protein [Saprospirales bacterium]|nr:AtpZ/AtpI family protein [Saprospirales bacterium]MBK8491139.1 AtpZ/AtpI family protein [Saprospirales bacterium]